MTLQKAFRTDAEKTTNGVWFDYPEHANNDGSIPGFLMARNSVGNPRYGRLLAELQEKYKVGGDEKMTDAADAQYSAELFVDGLLLGWRNFQPNDVNEMPYSRDNAMLIFGSAEWGDLRIDLRVKSSLQVNYAKVEATIKN